MNINITTRLRLAVPASLILYIPFLIGHVSAIHRPAFIMVHVQPDPEGLKAADASILLVQSC
jgi:hypothetical protein